MSQALGRHVDELVLIDGVESSLTRALAKPQRILDRLPTRQVKLARTAAVARSLSKEVQRRLGNVDVDAVLSLDTVPVAYLRTGHPVAFWNDATFAGMLDYYPQFSHLSRRTIAQGNAVAQAALTTAARAIYSSEWAAETAILNYQCDPHRVHVVPFGANLDPGEIPADSDALIADRTHAVCRLLFIGVDWHRKGADVAVAVAVRLNERHIRAELDVVGCQPPPGTAVPPYVHVLGRVDKATAEDRRQLTGLLAQAHFFVLPSRAEAYGLVLAEASAFGVPSLASRTGGVPTAVADNVNGRLFDVSASPDDYADAIIELYGDREKYRRLAASSHERFRSCLNWDTAAEHAVALMTGAVAEHRGHRDNGIRAASLGRGPARRPSKT